MDNSAFINRYSHIPPIMLPTCSRSVNASSAERSLLLRVISGYLSVLDARDNDSRTLRHKCVLWEQVTKKFNSMSSLPRSRHQIQTLYKNMKAKAKKYQQRIMEAKVTDAPHTIPEPDPISEVLLNLLAGEHEQRLLQIKRNAFNLSEMTVNVSPDEILHDEFSPEESFNATSERSSDCFSPVARVKNEPSGQDETAIEDSMLADDQTDRSVSRSPADTLHFNNNNNNNNNNCLPNASEESSTPNLASNSMENDTSLLNYSPKPNNKRARLHSQSSQGDTPRVLPNFFRNGGQALFSRDLINDGLHNPFRFPESHVPNLPGLNKQCCCPGLHSELVAMAKEEHNLRMRASEEERRQKEEEHREKMKLMRLEQDLCQRKIRLTERSIIPNENKQTVHNETHNNPPPIVGLNQWESLYNTNNSINSMNMNLGSDNNLAPKDINHTPYHNDYNKLSHQSNI